MSDLSPRAGQSGNVFLFILMGVALFGALMFTMSRGMNEGAGHLNKKQAALAATELITYVQQMERAVSRLQRKGVSENDISFENDTVAGYENADCTTDSCKIFKPSGGGLSWKNPPEGVNNGYGWRFVTDRVGMADNSENFGTSAQELVMIFPYMDNDVCDQINEDMNGLDVWESDGQHNGGYNIYSKFQGSYDTSSNGINRANIALPPYTGCFCDDSGACDAESPRFFYHVLMVR